MQDILTRYRHTAGVLIGTHAHEVMSIMQHLMNGYDKDAGNDGQPVQVRVNVLRSHSHVLHLSHLSRFSLSQQQLHVSQQAVALTAVWCSVALAKDHHTGWTDDLQNTATFPPLFHLSQLQAGLPQLLPWKKMKSLCR